MNDCMTQMEKAATLQFDYSSYGKPRGAKSEALVETGKCYVQKPDFFYHDAHYLSPKAPKNARVTIIQRKNDTVFEFSPRENTYTVQPFKDFIEGQIPRFPQFDPASLKLMFNLCGSPIIDKPIVIDGMKCQSLQFQKKLEGRPEIDLYWYYIGENLIVHGYAAKNMVQDFHIFLKNLKINAPLPSFISNWKLPSSAKKVPL